MAAMRPAILVISFLLLATGCGQRGPLYLRDNPPPGMKAPRPEAYKPLPYPKDAGEDGSADGAKK
jgi:predicted small lipoprotein YifL